jgi:hypothetical protein
MQTDLDDGNSKAPLKSMESLFVEAKGMPTSVKVGLTAIAILAAEQTVLLALAICIGQLLTTGDAVVFGIILCVCISLFVGLYRGSRNAWASCQALCWIGIVLLGVVVALGLRLFQSGKVSLLGPCFYLVHIGVLGVIYHAFRRKTAKAYFRFESLIRTDGHEQLEHDDRE